MPINSFLYPAPSLPPAYSVANSCLFNRADGPNMTKTPGSSGNLRKWTWSCWVKRGTISNGSQTMFNAGSSSNTQIRFDSDDTINFYQYSSSYTARLATNAKYRDPSAWMHVVAHWDTDNSTAGDRMKLFVNGTEVTSFAADVNPALNLDSYWNASGTAMYVGDKGDGAEEMDGYLAEVVFIDGQNLAPTSFGEFDEGSPNIWKPIDVSGLTFGTNGFYLDYEDSSNLGNDVNGGTDLTEVNLAATDQTTDTPENNFASLNPLYNNSLVYTEGNCKITEAGDWQSSFSTIGATSGKWYMEFKCSASTGGTNNFSGGICALDGVSDAAIALTVPGGSGSSIISYGYENDGTKDVKNTSSSYGSTYGSASTDIIGVYMDLDNNKLYFAKNGTVQDSGTGISIDDGYTYGFTVGDYYGTSEANFGNPTFSISSSNSDPNGYGSFEYSTTITGDGSSKSFYALCTKNLAEYG